MLICGVGLAAVSVNQAWGSSSEPLTVPPVSADSCERGGCLVTTVRLESNPQILQSDEVQNYTETNPIKVSEAATLDDVFTAVTEQNAPVEQKSSVEDGSANHEESQLPILSLEQLNSDLQNSARTQQSVLEPQSSENVTIAQVEQTAPLQIYEKIIGDDEANTGPHVPEPTSSDEAVEEASQEPDAANTSEQATSNSATPSFEIGLPMLMDERYLGDVTVRVTGDVVRVNGRSMLRLLKSDLTEQALRDLEALLTEELLVIDDINIEGLDVSYDPALQQVNVRTPIDSRQIRVLKLGADVSEVDVAVLEPGNVSFFVTPIISALYNWNDDQGFDPLRGSINWGGRVFGEEGVAFLSRHSFTGGNEGRFRRNETVAYYDRLDKLLRVSAGDLRPRGLAFQSTPRIAGLSIERFFNLEPNRLFRPTADSTFELERPSTVDIRLNGITRREIVLQPGRYNIDDLPLAQGSNLVDLVIRDDLGRERTISDQSFFDFGLLEPGISDYSLSVGVKSETTTTGIDYTDEFAATGFIRRGINNSLTLGLDAQGDKTGGNVGVSGLYATSLGVFRLEASASDYEDVGSGYAGELGYRYLGGDYNDWAFSFTGNASYFSENFSTLRNTDNVIIDINQFGQDAIFDEVNGESATRPFSVLLNGNSRLRKGKVTLTAAASHNIGRGDVVDRTNIVGGVTYQLSDRLSIGTFGRYSMFDDQREKSANIQLNYRLGRGATLRANYDTDFNELDVQYNKAASNGVGSLSYNLATRSNFDNDTHGISGNAFYTGNRFEANLDHSLINQTGGDGGDFQQFSQLSVTSSLVFVDGAFGVGRPIQSTFSILEPHETLRGRKVLVNPTESGYNTSSDFLGPAVASEGQAFSTRSTYYDVENLPIGYDLGEGQYNTRAPIYAGYKVKVGSGASFTVIGYLKDKESGEILPNFGGRLESLDNPSVEPISAFTNRNGRLAASGLKAGRYKLTIFDDPSFEKIITITDGDEPLIQLGDMELTVK